MKKLNEIDWKAFDIQDIFPEIKRGKRLKTDDHIDGTIPYVSSSAINNGVDDFIGNTEKVRIFQDCLSLANSGSVGASFYHPYQYVASDHVTKLKNEKFNRYIYLFLSTVASRISEKYSFNREINESRINREKILVPTDSNGNPDFVYMEQYMKYVENRLIRRYKSYLQKRKIELRANKTIIIDNNIQWKVSSIEDEFDVYSGVRLTKESMVGGNTPFVGASDSNNGVTAFCGNMNKSLDSNVLGVNYNGSVVETFYHPYEALFSDDVKRLKLKNNPGNKYIYLFIKNLILKQKIKYQYGYKFNGERMIRQKIKLPVTSDGQPDYKYMETFMQNKEIELLDRYIKYRSLNYD